MQPKNSVTDFCKFYLQRHYKKFLFILLFEIVSATSSPMIAYRVKNIIDYVSHHMETLTITGVLPSFKMLVGVILLSICANRASGLINMFTMPVIRSEIRHDSFAYLQRHSHKYFVDNFSGALGHRINELSNQFSTIFSMFLFHFLPVSISILTTIVIISTVSITFTIAILSWIMCYLSISILLSRGLKKRSQIWAEKQSAVSGRIVDSISNIFNIRAFANHDYEKNYLNNYLDDELKARHKMFVFMEINRLFQGIANLLLLAGSVFLSLYLLSQKAITLGDFVLIYSLSYTIMNNLERVSLNILDLFESIGNFRDSVETINKPYEIRDKKGAKTLEIKKGEIKFSAISFSYNNKKKIFDNLVITIKGQEKIGLVGISGSGKTTFTNLLLRLYDLDEGEITIDGQDISKVTQKSLHQNITLIPQDPILFNRSLLENIKYGNVEATHDDVIKAAKKAHAHDFIMNLPKGYDSLVGERGVKLSGGQRQRIAIARAFIKNAPIVIMDEATSSLDSITEQEISESFKDLIKKRTVLVIAHRLSTLKLMSRIIVFNQGKIIEDGSHEELIKLGGEYAKMWAMQQGGKSASK